MSILQGKDILRTDLLSDEEVQAVLKTAARFERALQDRGRLANMEGQILATLFFEPSTRTRLSFETAMLRLGGQVITVADPKTSSAAKGESLADSMRTVEGYQFAHLDLECRDGSGFCAKKPITWKFVCPRCQLKCSQSLIIVQRGGFQNKRAAITDKIAAQIEKERQRRCINCVDRRLRIEG